MAVIKTFINTVPYLLISSLTTLDSLW